MQTNTVDIAPGVLVDFEACVTVKGNPVSTGRRSALVVEAKGRTVRAVMLGPRPGVVILDVADIVKPLRWAKVWEVNRLLKCGQEFGFSTSSQHVKRALYTARAAVRAHKKTGGES